MSQKRTPEQLDRTVYFGNDLGAVYTPAGTQFKVWAPTASSVTLCLFDTWDSDVCRSVHSMAMTPETGVWQVCLDGDWQGILYTYRVTVETVTRETVDPYAKAAGLNGNRGMVINLPATDPEGWETDRHVITDKITDAVIWEVHVRDFSCHPSSGVSENHRGKYLAFTEDTTLFGEGRVPTGLTHLKNLGVNYIHLLPVFDYENDECSAGYNWGYDPKNYNVPEGAYSTNPADGTVRIREFKQMVQAIHQAGIGVVMDVVYNHTENEDCWFERIVPGYYFRQSKQGEFCNGSGCGNETASERTMMRKYMLDSVLYWTEQYHIDGFRFDLMGLHDVDTMNLIRKALDDAGYGNVILYGEPWYAGSCSMDGRYLPAVKENARYLNRGIAVFNDDIRDPIQSFAMGNHVESPNYHAQKRQFCDRDLMAGVVGCCHQGYHSFSRQWAVDPSQTIAYASCHDNHALWDRLAENKYGAGISRQQYRVPDEELIARNRIAAALVILSQGACFFQAGEEFGRTKYGDENSFVSPIEVNQLDWENLLGFSGLAEYYQGLLKIRRAFSPFRDDTVMSGMNTCFSKTEAQNVLAFTVENVLCTELEWHTAAVLLNATQEEQTVILQTRSGHMAEEWSIFADSTTAGIESLGGMTGNVVTLPPLGIYVLAQL